MRAWHLQTADHVAYQEQIKAACDAAIPDRIKIWVCHDPNKTKILLPGICDSDVGSDTKSFKIDWYINEVELFFINISSSSPA
jgi:hypothetical protein